MTGLYGALQQSLPQYDVMPLTEDNYADVCEIFDTNHGFLKEGYGDLIDKNGVLAAMLQLPKGFDIANKYLAVLCENGKPIAAVDLLANSPKKGELWLSFLVVHGDMHGRGIGTNITKGIIAAVKLAGFKKIHLGSFDETVDFWRKQGFICYCAEENLFGYCTGVENA